MSRQALFRREPGPARSFRLGRDAVLGVLFVVELIVFARLSPYFLTASNLLDATRSAVEIGLIALGATLVIITGGIDLSVGALLALVSVTVGFTYQDGLPLPFAVGLGLLVGLLGGAFNGALIVGLDLHPFAVTLGTFALFRGIAYAVSNAGAVSVFPDWFAYLGGYFAFGVVPGQLAVLGVSGIAVWLLLARTRFGSYVYALGMNEQATRFSGVPVLKIKLAVYALTGVLVAVAGVIYTSRMSTARGNAGLGLELSVIAAVVLGGASITGGAGTIPGTILGVAILSLLQNGLTLAGVRSDWGLIVVGVALVVGVFANEFFRQREV